MNLTSQQDRIIREKFTRHLENSNTDDDRSHKRKRGQDNEDEIEQVTPKNKVVSFLMYSPITVS